jgi:hypothetical protein
MTCALSEAQPLALAGVEVLDSMVRGALASPNSVLQYVVCLTVVVPDSHGSRVASQKSENPSNCLTKSDLGCWTL